MIPNDRLICALVENKNVGDKFLHWPLHITIVPWFRADITTDVISQELTERLNKITPFSVVVGEEAHLGYRGSKMVNLVHLPSPLEHTEQIARELLHEYDAWLVDETTKKRRDFLPHITVQSAERMHEGNSFGINNLYIVEQKGDYKLVASQIHL